MAKKTTKKTTKIKKEIVEEVKVKEEIVEEILYSDETRIKLLNVIFEHDKFSKYREDIDGFILKLKSHVDIAYAPARKYKNFDFFINRVSNNAIENLITNSNL